MDGAAVGASLGDGDGTAEGPGVATAVGKGDAEGVAVGYALTSPSTTQRWSENGALRS